MIKVLKAKVRNVIEVNKDRVIVQSVMNMVAVTVLIVLFAQPRMKI